MSFILRVNIVPAILFLVMAVSAFGSHPAAARELPSDSVYRLDLPLVDQDTRASKLAEDLGRELYNMRETVYPRYQGIDAALDEALALGKSPVVLADVSDNSGGGAPGDSTFVLRRYWSVKLRMWRWAASGIRLRFQWRWMRESTCGA